ncbi:MAG TPA: hypothetical protein VKT49_15955 [Bryobacteraceae bacterium]|nr:hypothetical protein [Bryobacteraceae bacterium]
MPANASLTGTWAMDRIRSDFGKADAPRQFVLRIEQTGNHLAATVFSADAGGRRVSFRECRMEPQPSGALACLLPDGGDEQWQLTAANELTITRVITASLHPTRQRLVLERSTLLDY